MTTTGLGGRADTFRALRAQAEASVLPLATSLDGRRFTFQSRIEGLELRLGGYVMLEGGGRTTLGQVRSLALAEADVGEVGLAGEGDADIRTQLRVRLARGEGVVLDGSVEPFHDHLARPATPEEIRTWLADVAPRRASLAVGGLSLAGGTPVRLDAGGFDRHTFLCGQSGSGKSYSLGLVLEQLLLETDLRIVILDPNSDCARLAELREDVPPDLADRWAALAPGIRVRSAESTGDERLRLRFGELAPATQAALLQLDPVGDREEYAELRALLVESRPESIGELAAADRPEARRLGLRLANLGLESLGVWARTDAGSLLGELDDPSVRCLVVDTGSLATREEQALVAESVLRGIWERRRERRPVLVVIDEAHNVCPAAPADALTTLATEHAVRIAGEGRKFGIYMLVATQRPQKVQENVISQCDNLVLMRLNSAADAASSPPCSGSHRPRSSAWRPTSASARRSWRASSRHIRRCCASARASRARAGVTSARTGRCPPLTDRHRRAGGEDADTHVRRVQRGEALELAGRHGRIVSPPHAGARERAPVDGYRHPRFQEPCRLCGALGIQVPRFHARPPAPHRQQRDVDVIGQSAHAVEEVGIAGEVDARAALDQEAHRAEIGAERQPASVVQRLRHHHVQAPHAHVVARRDADRVVPGPPLHELRHAVRRDHPDVRRQHPQRGQVEMVEMGVRDEHGVDVGLVPGSATSRRMWAIRARSTGSVSTRVPSRSIRVVA